MELRRVAPVDPAGIVRHVGARRYFPNESPIGKRIGINTAYDGDELHGQLLTIIGVAGDVKESGLENEIMPELYLPHSQVDYNISSIPIYLIVRTAGDPLRMAAPVRQAVHTVEPDVPAADIRTMESRLDGMVAQRRLRMTLLAAYAGLALLLAAVGIYGVLAYFVTHHAMEIGIRMALGAQAGDVLLFVLRRGMGMAIAGVGIGLIASLAVTRLMKSLLFGVSANDPLTLGLTAVTLISVALLACWIPARRATKVDPLAALRVE